MISPEQIFFTIAIPVALLPARDPVSYPRLLVCNNVLQGVLYPVLFTPMRADTQDPGQCGQRHRTDKGRRNNPGYRQAYEVTKQGLTVTGMQGNRCYQARVPAGVPTNKPLRGTMVIPGHECTIPEQYTGSTNGSAGISGNTTSEV